MVVSCILDISLNLYVMLCLSHILQIKKESPQNVIGKYYQNLAVKHWIRVENFILGLLNFVIFFMVLILTKFTICLRGDDGKYFKSLNSQENQKVAFF